MKNLSDFITKEHKLTLTDFHNGMSFVEGCRFYIFDNNPNILVTEYNIATEEKCKVGFCIIHTFMQGMVKKREMVKISYKAFSDPKTFLKLVSELTN